MNWYDDDSLKSKFISIKIGEKEVLDIDRIEKCTTGDPKYQLKGADNKPKGFSFVAYTKDGRELNINTFKLLSKMRELKITEGVVEVSHPAKGEWVVTRINPNDGTPF